MWNVTSVRGFYKIPKEREKINMKLLERVINKLVRKYDSIELEETNIIKNMIRLNFYMKRTYYTTLEITKLNNNKWGILIMPNSIKRITDLKGVIDMVLIFERYSNAKEYTYWKIQQIKEKYTEGTKIKLIKMYDYINPVPSGTKGIVERVDNNGIIHVIWENDSKVILIADVDEFEIIKDQPRGDVENWIK